MAQDQYISLREWFVKVWQKQGKTIDDLAITAGFSMKPLQEHLDRRVSTLGEWWELMGKYLYKTKENFAKALGIPRSTLKDYIAGKKTPKYIQYHQKLFAATALPIFAAYGQPGSQAVPIADLRTASDLEILFHLRLLEDSLEKVLYEMGELTAMRLTGVHRERFEKIVLAAARTLGNAAEEIRAVHRLEKAVKG